MARLELAGVCKGWDFPVLDEISLEVPEGEFFVVVGPSGAGKTTLLRLIAGLETPDAGAVLLDGEDVTSVPPYRRGAAMTFESYALYPQLNVFENIASPLRARRLPKDKVSEKVTRVAELLRINRLLDRRPGEISGGQKQRTALGRTLVATPRVFLLDEPLSHLDAKIRIELREQFHSLEELRKTATVYVTHDYAEALSLGDRIGVLRDGRLQQVGTPSDVFENPASIDVARQFGQPEINLLDVRHSHSEGALHVSCGPGPETLRLRVAREHARKVEGCPEGLQLGIRPQHIAVQAHQPGLLPATVSSFQSLGSYGVLSCTCHGIDLQVLTDPEADHQIGDEVALDFEPEHFVWFDADGIALAKGG